MRMDIRTRNAVKAGLGVLALSLAAGAAHADSNDMGWLGIAYLWAADIELDARDDDTYRAKIDGASARPEARPRRGRMTP